MRIGLRLVLIVAGCALALTAGVLRGVSSVFHEEEKNFKEQNHRSD